MPTFPILISILILSPTIASAEVIPFKVSSLDGQAQISGQIDKPDCGLAKYPTVLIVGGTGLFTRNGFFGLSRTERDLVFSDLSKRLNSRCIAIARFDYRGVSCDLKAKADISKCIDQKVRSVVSDETILNDIQVVHDNLRNYYFFEPRKLVLIGHSEGSLNISRLIARKSVNPIGLLFFGGVAESAKSILHWQIAERPVEWAFEMDSDHNGELTNNEIKSGYSQSRFAGIMPVENLLSPDGFWTEVALSKEFEDVYQFFADTALASSDTDPHMENGVVFSSSKWWKRWFRDDRSTLQNLQDFEGHIEYHNGDIDSQTPGRRELKFLTEHSTGMRSVPQFVLHPGKGHTLGFDPLYGPMDEAIADQIVQSVFIWTQ